MNIPQYVLACIERLEMAGFEAWAVGGCVRDSLMGSVPADWDLCTNALPQEIKACFSDHRLVLAGEKHGTVAVLCGGQSVEITTFRQEGDYSDSRHPGWVTFVEDIDGDLARRDFTINAMAYHPRRGLRDPFGGQEDLQDRVLRAVGVPEQRFREDALRILRGLRFSARLNLTGDAATQKAMCDLAPLVANLARERVYDELCKLLLSTGDLYPVLRTYSKVIVAAIPALAPAVGFDQHNPHHKLNVYDHIALVTASVPADLTIRWAALLHDVGKPSCFTQDSKGVGHFYSHAAVGADTAKKVLTSLRAPKALISQVCTLVRWHGVCFQYEPKTIRRLLARLGEETVWQLLTLDRGDSRGKPGDDNQEPFDRFEENLRKILEEAQAFSLKNLAVSGRDLMAAGIEPGPRLGQVLNQLLAEVIDGNLINSRQALIQRALDVTRYDALRDTEEVVETKDNW